MIVISYCDVDSPFFTNLCYSSLFLGYFVCFSSDGKSVFVVEKVESPLVITPPHSSFSTNFSCCRCVVCVVKCTIFLPFYLDFACLLVVLYVCLCMYRMYMVYNCSSLVSLFIFYPPPHLHFNHLLLFEHFFCLLSLFFVLLVKGFFWIIFLFVLCSCSRSSSSGMIFVVVDLSTNKCKNKERVASVNLSKWDFICIEQTK